MVFSSFTFLLGFLPLFLAVYFLLPVRLHNGMLFLGSLIFYAWGEPVYVTLLLFSTLVDYVHGILVDRFRGRRAAKAALLSSVLINAGLLCVFKYSGLLVETWNSLTGLGIPVPGFKLPIGISFYTFQTMSYTIDVYRGKAPVQKNIIAFGAYVSMFPQLIAGPIVRYVSVQKELDQRSAGFWWVWEKRCCWQIPSEPCGICIWEGRMSAALEAGWEFWPLACRSTMIFPAIRIWLLVWDACWDFPSRRILHIPIFPAALRSSGGAGI